MIIYCAEWSFKRLFVVTQESGVDLSFAVFQLRNCYVCICIPYGLVKVALSQKLFSILSYLDPNECVLGFQQQITFPHQSVPLVCLSCCIQNIESFGSMTPQEYGLHGRGLLGTRSHRDGQHKSALYQSTLSWRGLST